MKTVFSIKEAQVSVGEFFIKLLHSATNTHILHLQSRNYSEHKALGKFYEEIVELTDGLIESYQGRKGVLVDYPNTYDPPKQTGLDEILELASFIDANRSVLGTESELQNEVDSIRSLVDSTIYKLIYLR